MFSLKPAGTYDAIVVLGAAVWANETPSPSLKRRALHAAQLFKSGKAPVIICSGGLGRFPPAEATMIKRLCMAEGIDQEKLIEEDQSTTTLENISFSTDILLDKGAKSVLVVTDRYHIPRAKMCFRFFGFECDGSGPQRGKSGTPLRKCIYYHLREIAALPYYYLKLLKLKHKKNPAR